MHDAFPMKVLDGVEGLPKDDLALVLLDALVGLVQKVVGQGGAFDKLHHYVHIGVIVNALVKLHYVRVVHLQYYLKL